MKTAKIQSSPMDHLCQKCFDQVQWRIDYRKYKPLSVLGKCNYCARKNITKAYRTICDPCANVPFVMKKQAGSLDVKKTEVEDQIEKEGEVTEAEVETKEDDVEVESQAESQVEDAVEEKHGQGMKRCAKCCGPTTKYAHKPMSDRELAKKEDIEDSEAWEVLNTLKEREK